MEKARSIISNHDFRGKLLKVEEIKRKLIDENVRKYSKKKSKIDFSTIDLRNQLMPNFNKPLKIQLEEKEKEMKNHLKTITLNLTTEHKVKKNFNFNFFFSIFFFFSDFFFFKFLKFCQRVSPIQSG